MISKIVGTVSKKDTKTKIWWAKLFVALVLSNVFFFVLFSSSETEAQKEFSSHPEGWVEVQLEAQLLTTFHKGKKVLLINRKAQEVAEGVLEAQEETGEKWTIYVPEESAYTLLSTEGWEILPYLKNIKLKATQRGENHEIRY